MSAASADDLAWLVARARVIDLVADYTNAVDWLDWALLDAVCWPDATFDFGMFRGDYPAFRAFVGTLEGGYARRLHMFGLPRVKVSGNHARMEVASVTVCRTEEPAPGIDDTFFGRYLLAAEARDGVWKLAKLTFVLNLYDRAERTADDRGGPMNYGDGVDIGHPFAALR